MLKRQTNTQLIYCKSMNYNLFSKHYLTFITTHRELSGQPKVSSKENPSWTIRATHRELSGQCLKAPCHPPANLRHQYQVPHSLGKTTRGSPRQTRAVMDLRARCRLLFYRWDCPNDSPHGAKILLNISGTAFLWFYFVLLQNISARKL